MEVLHKHTADRHQQGGDGRTILHHQDISGYNDHVQQIQVLVSDNAGFTGTTQVISKRLCGWRDGTKREEGGRRQYDGAPV